MRFALFGVGFLALATSFLSLVFMNSMMQRIQDITQKDAALAAVARGISIKMLEARREEKNFIIYLDSTHIVNTRQIIIQVMDNIKTAREIAPEYVVPLDSMMIQIDRYSANIELLGDIFQEDPRALSSIQQQIITYEKRLKQTVGARNIERDSLPSWISDLNVLMASAATKVSTEKARLLTDLRASSDMVLALSEEIASKAQASLIEHGEEGVKSGLRAQRNALIIFIVTGIVLVYLIYYLPNRILIPFRRITRALKVIGTGQTEVTLPDLEKGDEFWQLFQSFQEAIRHLKLYNDLKTDKIIHLKKQLTETLELVKEAVVIINRDLEVTYFNSAAAELLGIEEASVHKKVKDVPAIDRLIGKRLSESMPKELITFTARIKKTDLKKRSLCIIPVAGKNGSIESIVLMVK
ncbi:MAG: PAS domain-containing protein [candidate division WOR-3 bacterium]|nr:MAG: PAS domain-containing protein [candidate division WOR-3 bacterium]